MMANKYTPLMIEQHTDGTVTIEGTRYGVEFFRELGCNFPSMIGQVLRIDKKEKGESMSHLKFDSWIAQKSCNEQRHPQQVMKNLGITYTHATPQSIADQWWFWDCNNVPAELPKYLTYLDVDPMEFIGFGLTKEIAKSIKSLKSTKRH